MYGVIKKNKGKNKFTTITNKELSEILELSTRTITRCISELEQNEFIFTKIINGNIRVIQFRYLIHYKVQQ